MSHAAPAVLRVLGEPTRLRILALVQPRADGRRARGPSAWRRAASATSCGCCASSASWPSVMSAAPLLRAAFAELDPSTGADRAARLWRRARRSPRTPRARADVARLEGVLAARGDGDRDFFDRLAGDWDKLGSSFKSGPRARARRRQPHAARPRGRRPRLRHRLVRARVRRATRRASCASTARRACWRRRGGRSAIARAARAVEYREGELDALPLRGRASSTARSRRSCSTTSRPPDARARDASACSSPAVASRSSSSRRTTRRGCTRASATAPGPRPRTWCARWSARASSTSTRAARRPLPAALPDGEPRAAASLCTSCGPARTGPRVIRRRTDLTPLRTRQEQSKTTCAAAPRRRRRTCQPQTDFKVKDLSLAEFGRKEIELAEVEMPGLMALRARVPRASSRSRARASPARCT